ncbi:MAG TPA: folate-binding protein [Herbaspirillum sp.]|nr:folate-binding protein [Herbaspirillum sp.]
MIESTLALSPWQAFLVQQGARIEAENDAEVRHFGACTTALPENFVAPLTDLGLIALSGDDAAGFLHRQITNDVEKLDPANVRLAGYCTPKGRLLATFLMWKESGQIMLQLPRTILPPVQKRLRMFVLRARVQLTDVSEQYVTLGLAGDAAAQVLQQWFPHLPAHAYTRIANDNGTLMRLADSYRTPRYQWITNTGQAISAWPVLTQKLTATGTYAWRLSDIYAGVPMITQPTQERFVPQMINFELIGGVDFKKGCYPGQEIVARSQYLGKLKRRSVLALIDATGVHAGAEVFSSVDAGQPCGMVINAEPAGNGQSACLVEIKLAAADNGSIHLGAADGPVLQLQKLPYTFFAQETRNK